MYWCVASPVALVQCLPFLFNLLIYKNKTTEDNVAPTIRFALICVCPNCDALCAATVHKHVPNVCQLFHEATIKDIVS